MARWTLSRFLRLLLQDTSIGEESIDSALLSHDASDEKTRIDVFGSTTTSFSAAELPAAVADSLNAAAKQFSHFYESLNSTTTTEHGEEVDDDGFDLTAGGNFTGQSNDHLTNGLAQPYPEQTAGSTRFLHLYRTNVSLPQQQQQHRQPSPKQPRTALVHHSRNDTL